VTSRAAFVFAAALVALGACGGSRGAAAPARAPNAATDLIPGDVDVVVRVDWPKLVRSPLYARAPEAISSEGLARIAHLRPVLKDARAVLVGLRILSDGLRGDGVLVIETDDPSLDPDLLADHGPRFGRLPDAGGAAVFERRGDLGRGDAALVAILPRRGIAIATPSEADALLRMLRHGPDAGRLDPPARGLVSFAGRIGPGARGLEAEPGGRLLRRISKGLEAFSGAVDLVGGTGVSLQADLEYASAADAETGDRELRAAGEALGSLGATARAVARAVTLSRHDRIVTIRAAIASSRATPMP
jgi:hypothetical protein